MPNPNGSLSEMIPKEVIEKFWNRVVFLFSPVNRTETSLWCTSLMIPRLIGISKVYITNEIKVNE